MKLFKNRTVLGIFCIAVSLIICFAITPLVNAGLSKKVTIVRFNRQVNEGEEITRSMLDEVEVGNHNLPENVIRNIADVEGKYLTTTVYAGDYILTPWQLPSIAKYASMPEVSKIVMSARAGFSFWHISSVRSTR